MPESDHPDDQPSEPVLPEFLRLARQIGLINKADVLLFSAELFPGTVVSLIEMIRDRQEAAGNPSQIPDTAVLILTTEGGDPHAAYMLARTIDRAYENLILLLFGRCKSAGTLIALSADKIKMGPLGQLGPLDMQTLKEDEILLRNSVLDIQQSLDSINAYAFRFFRRFLRNIIETSGGTITTKTASEIASDMATDLLEPISSQIDPLRIGEDMRSMLVAEEYGKRLAEEKSDAIQKLTQNYPSHSFVIDIHEAKEIFGKDVVCKIDGLERELERSIDSVVKHQSAQPIFTYLYHHDIQSQPDESHDQDEKSGEGAGPGDDESDGEDLRSGGEDEGGSKKSGSLRDNQPDGGEKSTTQQ